MLFFLVAVVREDGSELLILAGIDTLVVPVHGFELFHDRDHGTVALDGIRLQHIGVFMQIGAGCGHDGLLVSSWDGRSRSTRPRCPGGLAASTTGMLRRRQAVRRFACDSRGARVFRGIDAARRLLQAQASSLPSATLPNHCSTVRNPPAPSALP